MDFVFKILAYLYTVFVGWSWDTQVMSVLGFVWCALNTFYVVYLAAINVWRNRSDVSRWVLILLSPMLGVMAVMDTIMNWTIFTVLTLDLPREWFVTSRLERYRAQVRQDWRHHLANFICTKLLNPFDPTKQHC